MQGGGGGLTATALARAFESKSILTETQAGFMFTAARSARDGRWQGMVYKGELHWARLFMCNFYYIPVALNFLLR